MEIFLSIWGIAWCRLTRKWEVNSIKEKKKEGGDRINFILSLSVCFRKRGAERRWGGGKIYLHSLSLEN